MALVALVIATMPASLPAQGSERTIVTDRPALQRLRRNSGITLQWISFSRVPRGHVRIDERRGLIRLTGSQSSPGSAARLDVDGEVLAIGPRSFTFRGRIAIENAPDPGRQCLRDGTFEFRVTGNRRYWRMQNIEACDGLADYVDIYF